ncbi:hypothetical protein DFH09DRAFT_1101496 [Mycena vulgaris]|nr:hypothetical protein DFH09DRAFT_1101496 [Mycena vulgaris]
MTHPVNGFQREVGVRGHTQEPSYFWPRSIKYRIAPSSYGGRAGPELDIVAAVDTGTSLCLRMGKSSNSVQEIELRPPPVGNEYPNASPEGPNASEEEQDGWEAAISAFVINLVLHRLSHEKPAAQLFALFDAPEYQPMLFYYACADLLDATRELSEAGEHIGLVAALFGLLKEEGLKRDDTDVVFPTARAQVGDIAATPGYKYDSIKFILVPDREYVKGKSFVSDLAEYGRKQEEQLYLWSLVGRLEANYILIELSAFSLMFHQAPLLLCALENPVQRGVWETLWAAVMRCDEEMAWGTWGMSAGNGSWLGPFKDAARKIAGDQRAPMEWRARFAMRVFVIVEELEKKR